MRFFATLSISVFWVFLLSGALGFSALPSVHGDESKSPGSDAAESNVDKKEPWKPEDVIGDVEWISDWGNVVFGDPFDS